MRKTIIRKSMRRFCAMVQTQPDGVSMCGTVLVYAFVTREFRQDLTRNVTRNTRLVSGLRAGHDTRHEIWCIFVSFRVYTKYTNTKHENLKLKMALSSHRMTPESHKKALGGHRI